MRPKKFVLLYCQDGTLLGQMTFLLHTWGMGVMACDTLEAAFTLEKLECHAALVVAPPVRYDDAIVRWLKEANPEMKVVLLLRKPEPVQTWADAVVIKDSDNSALREALKIALARKRGPKTRAA